MQPLSGLLIILEVLAVVWAIWLVVAIVRAIQFYITDKRAGLLTMRFHHAAAVSLTAFYLRVPPDNSKGKISDYIRAVFNSAAECDDARNNVHADGMQTMKDLHVRPDEDIEVALQALKSMEELDQLKKAINDMSSYCIATDDPRLNRFKP